MEIHCYPTIENKLLICDPSSLSVIDQCAKHMYICTSMYIECHKQRFVGFKYISKECGENIWNKIESN